MKSLGGVLPSNAIGVDGQILINSDQGDKLFKLNGVWNFYGDNAYYLQGIQLDPTVPTNGQILQYNSGTSKWVPTAPSYTGDAILGQTGGGGARISGLQASRDIDVGGPSDDEFNAALSGWTTLGTPDALDANSTFKSHCYIQKNPVAGVNCVGIYKAWAPSAGDIWACKLTDTNLHMNDFQKVGMFLGLATPGNMVAVYWGTINNSVGVTAFTNPTTFSTNIFAPSTAYYSCPLYFAIRYNSSSSIDYLVSRGGLTWLRVATASNPGFTVGSIGLFVASENATSGTIAAFDWIRKLSGSIKEMTVN